MFHKSWVRNSVAFAAVLILIAIGTLLYLNAVSVANHRRIEDYRQQVGAISAADLWASSNHMMYLSSAFSLSRTK